MFKFFRPAIFIILSGILLLSCIKKITRKETEDNLRRAMDLYLNHQPKVDTSKVKFKVLDVVFFEDKTVYICNFKVNMKTNLDDHISDTTGAMSARISKDFREVSRTY
jgi:hypothetical protein